MMSPAVGSSCDISLNGKIISPVFMENNAQCKELQYKQLKCLQCDEKFQFPEGKDEYLAHLYLSHRLVIADVEDIENLESYLKYWIEEFKSHSLSEFCTTLLMDQLPDGSPAKNEKYYLLSDILPCDDQLRRRLHAERLEEVLAQHQHERTDRTFSRQCLYCRSVVTGLRADFLEHLYEKHFLQLGKPENLVFVDELIDVVQKKLESLVCLYCEKIFKDRPTLKEHMRKKGHKRINPDLKFYDKFFLVNYKNEKSKYSRKKSENLNSYQITPKTQRSRQRRIYFETELPEVKSPFPPGADSDSEWSDWDGEKPKIICLFCAEEDTDYVRLKSHILSEHELDFETEIRNLTFYQKIKVVNYIRRQMETLSCPGCNEQFVSVEDLRIHLRDYKHCVVGTKKQWDQPEYFFPTYEDDAILCHLEDTADDFDTGGVLVLSEDTNATINPDAEALSLENFSY